MMLIEDLDVLCEFILNLVPDSRCRLISIVLLFLVVASE